MAAFGFTTDRTNLLPAGITSWVVQRLGDTGGIELAPIADATVAVKTLSARDSLQRQFPFAFGFEARCKVLGTAKTTFLQKLALLPGHVNTHQITGINGKIYTAVCGAYFKFVCDGSIDANRYVEIGADLGLLGSSLDTLLSTGAVAAAGSADALYGMAPGTIYPAGFSAISTRNAGETAWETLGAFRNPSLTAELKVVKDQNLSSFGYAVNVNIGFDLMQTDEEILLLDSFAAGKPDLKVTLMDGTILTFADNTGVDFTLSDSSDMDDIVFIHVTATGTLTVAAFNSCIS
jgi:hypothetical protein